MLYYPKHAFCPHSLRFSTFRPHSCLQNASFDASLRAFRLLKTVTSIFSELIDRDGWSAPHIYILGGYSIEWWPEFWRMVQYARKTAMLPVNIKQARHNSLAYLTFSSLSLKVLKRHMEISSIHSPASHHLLRHRLRVQRAPVFQLRFPSPPYRTCSVCSLYVPLSSSFRNGHCIPP
ncbi:hypothetical protein CPB85DRAFT_48460 [Mucidula mucida]|nr:hypothetical protein CPB85DRAFT_48460 [Mucidula mucida]